MPLSDANNAALVTAGKNFAGFFATLAFQTFFYGIYAVLFISAIIVHSQKQSLSRAAKIMFVIIVGMFISTTIYYAASTAAMVAQMRAILVDQEFDELSFRLQSLGDLKIPYNILENWMSAINFCASDTVVVWRAWALSAGNRKIVMPSIILLILTLISSGIFAGYSTVTGNPATSPILWATIWAADQLAMESLSLLTNISATIVIAWKAWKHRKLSRASSKYHTQSESIGAQNILLVFVESGLVYILIQATLVILTYLFRFSPNDPVTANIIRSALGGYFGTFIILSGIYPTLVVFIVALQRSMSESRIWAASNMAPSSMSGGTHLLPQPLASQTSVGTTIEKQSYADPPSPPYQNYPFISNANPTTVQVQIPRGTSEMNHQRNPSEDSMAGWDMVTPGKQKLVDVEANGSAPEAPMHVRSNTTTTTSTTFSYGSVRPLPTTPPQGTFNKAPLQTLHERSTSLASSSNSSRYGGGYPQKSAYNKF